MKNTIRTSLALVAFSMTVGTIAQAQLVRVGPDVVKGKPTVEEMDTLPSSRGDIVNGPRVARPGNLVAVACAPEVVSGNVAATDRVLLGLLNTPIFKDEIAFKKEVLAIASMKDSGEKAARYLALVGVDANDSQAVVEFVGSREVKSRHLLALEKKAQLSAAQSELVAEKLQVVLRGSLQ